MSKKSFPAVTSQDQAWDDELDDWQDILENQPFPITNYATIAGLPAANQNDEGLAWADANDDADYTADIIVASDGTSWKKLAWQTPEINPITDGSGGTSDSSLVAISGSGDDTNINNNFADLAAKLNNLINTMRNNGAMASS